MKKFKNKDKQKIIDIVIIKIKQKNKLFRYFLPRTNRNNLFKKNKFL